MPPYLALLLWFTLLVGLLWFDPAKEPKVSAALWVPLMFMFFMASRQPSQWLNWEVIDAAAVKNALAGGNPLGRTVSSVCSFWELPSWYRGPSGGTISFKRTGHSQHTFFTPS